MRNFSIKLLHVFGCLLLGAITPTSTWAGSTSVAGTIKAPWSINAGGTGYLFFYLTSPHLNSTCTDVEKWAINISTPEGKAQYAAFMMAYASGNSLKVIGTGSCVSTAEEVHTLIIDR